MDAQQISRLTARWLADLPGDGSTVLSGLGAWPLLAILADLADEPARSELMAATGGGYDGGLRLFDGTTDVRAALALWSRPEVPLSSGLDAVLPPELRGVLTDQSALDRWVSTQTDGLLDRMPVQLRPDTLLVLASALAVRTTWRLPFEEYPRRGGFGAANSWFRWLSRHDSELNSLQRVDTLAGPLTTVTVTGAGAVDVRLVVGEPGRTRAEVLTAALSEPAGEAAAGRQLLAESKSGDEVAPAVTVIDSPHPAPQVLVAVPHFELDAEHDLLESSEALGLLTASDVSRGHFPRLSPRPLAVNQAKQAVMARFSATGFEAAAVTAMAVAAGGAPRAAGKALFVDLDRPFGFLAVHRATGIPVVVGWVSADALVPAA